MFNHGRQFGQAFAYHFLFAPYVLADWVLAALVRLLGAAWATRLFAVLVFLSLPAALYAYLRAQRAGPGVTTTLLLISLYLSTDTFFVLGFLSFRLGVAVLLLTLAAADPLSRHWSGPRYLVLVGMVVLAYLTHLAALVFVAVALGIRALMRILLRVSSVGREFVLLLPIGCVGIWHFAIAAGYRQPADQTAEHYIWGTAPTKAAGLLWEFLGYRSHWQALILTVFALCLATLCVAPARSLVNRSRRDGAPFSEPAMLEPLGIALAFLCVYIALPSSYSEASFVDVRAMALFWLFLIVGLARLHEWSVFEAPRAAATAFSLAVLVSALNLAYLGKQFRHDRAWLIQYRSVVAKVPKGSTVLPIYTAVKRGVVRSSLHAASYVVSDRAALIPYLFSGDRGDPMKYFRYISRPYAPDEAWYGSHQPVDWKEVAGQYQFLLVMKPFDATHIPLKGRTVAENQTAALVAIR